MGDGKSRKQKVLGILMTQEMRSNKASGPSPTEREMSFSSRTLEMSNSI